MTSTANRRMRFFDTHCDTVMPALESGLDFVKGGPQAHLDLPRLQAAGHCVQLFAVFTARDEFPGVDLTAYADQAIAIIRGWADSADSAFRIALTSADLRAACEGEAVWGLIGLEGADPLGDSSDNLERYYRAGVRSLIPAWGDNAFSGASIGSGGPLTAEGLRLIEAAEALRVMVDVSHLSDKGFWQLCDFAHRPFIASHSNCRALCPTPRNVTDEMIRAIADRGGVIGINLAPSFLDPGYLNAFVAVTAPARAAATVDRQQVWDSLSEQLASIPLPGIEWVARHALHIIEIGGEECVGLGGDLDGITAMPAGITGVESYPCLAESLAAAGLTEAQVEKACWRNMARVFQEVLE
jgi:membrane dipeptidase